MFNDSLPIHLPKHLVVTPVSLFSRGVHFYRCNRSPGDMKNLSNLCQISPTFTYLPPFLTLFSQRSCRRGRRDANNFSQLQKLFCLRVREPCLLPSLYAFRTPSLTLTMEKKKRERRSTRTTERGNGISNNANANPHPDPRSLHPAVQLRITYTLVHVDIGRYVFFFFYFLFGQRQSHDRALSPGSSFLSGHLSDVHIIREYNNPGTIAFHSNPYVHRRTSIIDSNQNGRIYTHTQTHLYQYSSTMVLPRCTYVRLRRLWRRSRSEWILDTETRFYPVLKENFLYQVILNQKATCYIRDYSDR